MGEREWRIEIVWKRDESEVDEVIERWVKKRGRDYGKGRRR